jgi:HlyD family secretion protein
MRFRVLAERAGVARLEAEQALAAQVAFPQDVRDAAATDERVREVVAKEAALFAARRGSLASEAQLLRAQGARVEEEIAALEAQIRQAGAALALQTKDLEANRGLVAGGFISPARLAQIESAVVDYSARLEERRSELARAAQKRVDIELRVKTLHNEYARQASDQLKAAAGRLAEIEQELRKSEDAAARQVVAAPASGEVIDLRFTSPGAVVRPGEPIAEIVPSEARLTVEARVRPEDVSNVRVGQAARVRFTAFKYRSAAMAQGRVTYVSADRLVDRATNLPYYATTILVDPKALAEAAEIKVQAGMPAEVYIEGDRQTPLQYLAEPVTSMVRKAARQM